MERGLLVATVIALAACSSEALRPDAKPAASGSLSEEAKRAASGAFVRVSLEEGGGLCAKRLAACATQTVVVARPPQMTYGFFGEPGMTKSLTEAELSRVTAVVDALPFRQLLAANREHCNHVVDAGATIEFVTDVWSGRDTSAVGCIFGGAMNTTHPYRLLSDVVHELRDEHFEDLPPPGSLTACLFNKGDAEICETYVESECLALGGTIRNDLKCIDGKRFP